MKSDGDFDKDKDFDILKKTIAWIHPTCNPNPNLNPNPPKGVWQRPCLLAACAIILIASRRVIEIIDPSNTHPMWYFKLSVISD